MTQSMTYQEALNALPESAQWSCSFGLPGVGGYCEYWRAPGQRFLITNGNWDATPEFNWTIEQA